MKINLLDNLSQIKNYDSYVIPFTSDLELKDLFEESFSSLLNPFLKSDLFEGKKEEIYSFTTFLTDSTKPVHVILLGLGDTDKANSEIVMNSFGKAIKKLQDLKVKKPLVILENIGDEMNRLESYLKAFKAMYLAEYAFDKYLGEKVHALESLDIFTHFKDADKCLKRAQMLADNIIVARNIVNEPANAVKPEDLANYAMEVLEGLPLDIEIKNKSEIEKIGMKAFLAVAQGSAAEPRLIVVNYKGDPSSKEKLALVGKGLTFDSGGYSIKPTDSMKDMRYDMAGSGAVIGAIKSIAEARLPVNVVAIVAACENMISGSSYLPGDIIGTLNGKTVEIVNTDAEGRLTLADAVTYAVRNEKATAVVDIATLTGAVLIGLGTKYAGIVTNDEELFEKVEKASKISSEKIWRLPYDDQIKEYNKSKLADLKNAGGRMAGSSTGGAFVGEFVEDIPWVHVDIAGTADVGEDNPYCRLGATGYGVELLFTLASII